jgi:uncharacterized protein YkwD
LLAGVAVVAAVQLVTVTEEEVVTVTKYVTAGDEQQSAGQWTTLVTSTIVSTPTPSMPAEDPSPTVAVVVTTPTAASSADPPPPPPTIQPTANLAPPTSQSGAPSENDPAFVNEVLQVVNAYRQQYSAGALSWDASLATYARGASDGCKMQHTVSRPCSRLPCPNWFIRAIPRLFSPIQAC